MGTVTAQVRLAGNEAHLIDQAAAIIEALRALGHSPQIEIAITLPTTTDEPPMPNPTPARKDAPPPSPQAPGAPFPTHPPTSSAPQPDPMVEALDAGRRTFRSLSPEHRWHLITQRGRTLTTALQRIPTPAEWDTNRPAWLPLWRTVLTYYLPQHGLDAKALAHAWSRAQPDDAHPATPPNATAAPASPSPGQRASSS